MPKKKDRLYELWHNIRNRCKAIGNGRYKYQITMDPRWEDYQAFLDDMSPHPGAGWTLDRKDNSLGYSKSNCRWATRTTQSRNRDYVKLDETKAAEIRRRYVRGKTRQRDIAAEFGVTQALVSQIVRGEAWI